MPWRRAIHDDLAANVERAPADLLRDHPFTERGGVVAARRLFGAELNGMLDELTEALAAWSDVAYPWQNLPRHAHAMATMNISLTDDLKQFVDEQVAAKSYTSTSEYLRELIRRQRDAEQFRTLIEDGLNSGPAVEGNEEFFADLKRQIRTGRIE